jgi:hypothetical protein
MAAALSAALTTLPAQRTKSLSQLLLPPVRMPLGLLMRQVVEGRCQRRQLVAKLMVWCVWATVFTLFVRVPPSNLAPSAVPSVCQGGGLCRIASPSIVCARPSTLSLSPRLD